MSTCKRIIGAACALLTLAAAVTAQNSAARAPSSPAAPTPPAPPTMPKMPTVNTPTIGGGFYVPGASGFYGPASARATSPASQAATSGTSSQAQTADSAVTGSTSSAVAANTASAVQAATAANQLYSTLSASDLNVLQGTGLLGSLSGLLGKSTNNALMGNTPNATASDAALLQQILAELTALKNAVASQGSQQGRGAGATTTPQPQATAAKVTTTPSEPSAGATTAAALQSSVAQTAPAAQAAPASQQTNIAVTTPAAAPRTAAVGTAPVATASLRANTAAPAAAQRSRAPAQAAASTTPATRSGPRILRFLVNGSDVLATCREVYFSAQESNGSFLLTADRTYQDTDTLEETLYLLFQAKGNESGMTRYAVTPSLNQQDVNTASVLRLLVQQDELTASRTGNIVAMRIDGDCKIDLLLSLDSD